MISFPAVVVPKVSPSRLGPIDERITLTSPIMSLLPLTYGDEPNSSQLTSSANGPSFVFPPAVSGMIIAFAAEWKAGFHTICFDVMLGIRLRVSISFSMKVARLKRMRD